ncbi:hypothetical protein [Sporosarcina koreensis]|uniref:hypothetical protein n=1 Tax=Sporosarcina koreensis TaxID=334735 RepID=UPI00058E4754|nr:hypothetical protein [Sporosarcina koreensis]
MSNTYTSMTGCAGCLLPIIGVILAIIGIFVSGTGLYMAAGVMAAFGILIFTISLKTETRRKKKQREKLFTYSQPGVDFTKLPSAASWDLLSRIAVDFREQRLYIWTAFDKTGQIVKKPFYGMDYRVTEYGFGEVVAAALVENRRTEAVAAACSTVSIREYIADTITKSKKLGISQDENGRIQLLALIVQTDDIIAPFHRLNFYYEESANIAKDSVDYEDARGSLQKWMNYMNELLEMTHPDSVERLQDPAGIPSLEEEPEYAEDGFEEDVPDASSFLEEVLTTPSSPEEATASLDTDRGTAKDRQAGELSYFEKVLAENKRMMDRQQDEQ